MWIHLSQNKAIYNDNVKVTQRTNTLNKGHPHFCNYSKLN
jgi:hypothetical protein